MTHGPGPSTGIHVCTRPGADPALPPAEVPRSPRGPGVRSRDGCQGGRWGPTRPGLRSSPLPLPLISYSFVSSLEKQKPTSMQALPVHVLDISAQGKGGAGPDARPRGAEVNWRLEEQVLTSSFVTVNPRPNRDEALEFPN